MPNPEKLAEAIKRSGKTQSRIADDAGITRQYLCHMLNKRINATENTLHGLSKALGCNVEDIM